MLGGHGLLYGGSAGSLSVLNGFEGRDGKGGVSGNICVGDGLLGCVPCVPG